MNKSSSTNSPFIPMANQSFQALSNVSLRNFYAMPSGSEFILEKDSGLSLSAPLIEWGPRIECVNGFTGTSPPHTYRNTTISLSQSAPNFPKSLITLNSTNSRIDSADGGQTWTVDTIHIKESRCT